jgi:hypothetical protein
MLALARRPIVHIILIFALVAIALFAGWRLMSSGLAGAGGSEVTITVGAQGGPGTWFCAPQYDGGVCPTKINAGDTVIWDWDGFTLPHTVTHCGADCDNPTNSPLFDSSPPMGSGQFEVTFNSAGVYPYRCEVHSDDMRGIITVNGNGGPTNTPQPTNTQAPTNTPAPTSTPGPTSTLGPSATPSDTPTPSVTPTATATLAPGVTPTVTPVPSQTPVTPTATRTDTPPATATPAGLIGDVDGNGQVNAIDAALILQFNAGLIGSLPNPGKANVDGTGGINAIDAALILQYVAGLIDALPP